MSEKNGNCDVAIVGAGLTGLSIALKLESLGLDVCVLESRARVGGRIHSIVHNDLTFDLGPAWFWTGQPLIAKLSSDLSLRVFQQYSSGDMLYQDASGKQIVRRAMSMMEGAQRIDGGMSALTDGLQERLRATVKLNCRVSELSETEVGLCVRYQPRNQTTESEPSDAQSQHTTASIDARVVVLAMPPRLIASSINTNALLTDTQLGTMRAIPTWMAGHAKVVAVYDKPFWRDQGLSGDAISHHGPMVQIHDATPFGQHQGVATGALFGFVGVPVAARSGVADELLASARKQLVALFGPAAAAPVKMRLQDWALQSDTATFDDADSPPSHPAYGMPAVLQSIENNTLMLAATELASTHGGLLEGALEMAEDTVLRIKHKMDKCQLSDKRL